MAVAQQTNNDAVVEIIGGQIAWINSMVAQGKMSQADGGAQITKLKVQLADAVLNGQSSPSWGEAAVKAPGATATPALPAGQGNRASADPPVTKPAALTAPINGTVPSGTARTTVATAASEDPPAPTHDAVDLTSVTANKKSSGQSAPAANQPQGGGNGQNQANANQPQGGGGDGQNQAKPAGSGCSEVHGSGTKPTLTSTTDSAGNVTYSGTLPGATSGTIRICVNDAEKTTVSVGSGGLFSAGNISADVGSVIVAQQVNGSGSSATYGPVSDEISAGTCSQAVDWSTGASPPTLNTLPKSGDYVSGTVSDAKQETQVRICKNNKQVAVVDVNDQGAFTAALTLAPTDSVTAQGIATASGVFPRKYGPVSSAQQMPGFAFSTRIYSRFITGVEQSGFSSEGSNTNAFVEAEFRGPYLTGKNPMDQLGITVWGRVRLLGGPLPSGTSVVAAITNPSGAITTSNLSNVGQVVDYVFGPEIRIHQKDHTNGNTDRISLIGGVGATTPLTSGGIQYSLSAPTANSQQCVQLLNNSPYSPLFTNIATGSDTCVIGDKSTKAKISTLSFSPVDRSNFLVKYGGGLRLTHIYPAKNGQAPYSGGVDFLVGQDQEITGGKFHGVVFVINGVYPLALGSSSFLYLFGSASMKTTGNIFYPPLVLGSAQAPTTPLPTSVEVVPLTQPNRDFYRFGVGVNLVSLICSATKNCNGGTGSGAANNSSSAANSGSTPANGGGAKGAGKGGQKQQQ
jgi:hypothetical protein